MKVVRAIYENGVFRPVDPVDFEDLTEVFVEPVESGRPRTREGVVNLLRLHRTRLGSEFGVKSITLFGSLARDEAGIDSDVDLLIEVERPLQLSDDLRLTGELSLLLDRCVDVHYKGHLKPGVSEEVAMHGVAV